MKKIEIASLTTTKVLSVQLSPHVLAYALIWEACHQNPSWALIPTETLDVVHIRVHGRGEPYEVRFPLVPEAVGLGCYQLSHELSDLKDMLHGIADSIRAIYHEEPAAPAEPPLNAFARAALEILRDADWCGENRSRRNQIEREAISRGLARCAEEDFVASYGAALREGDNGTLEKFAVWLIDRLEHQTDLTGVLMDATHLGLGIIEEGKFIPNPEP